MGTGIVCNNSQHTQFAFSSRDEILYIVGLDSLYTLSLKTLQLTGI